MPTGWKAPPSWAEEHAKRCNGGAELRKILVVDDAVTMRQMVSFTLRRGGFETVEAENGQDGLNKLQSNAVDMIITDLNMPIMDGITFIANVRKLPGMKTKPILMLTTEGHASKKEAGKAAGATGWVVKPFDPEKLLQTIAKVLP